MARAWKSRPTPPPTSITECARRYHACATALAQTLGLSLAEVLAEHRESVTAIFIETSRADLRLPTGVKLAPLVPPNGSPEAPVPEAVATPPETDPAEAPPDTPEGTFICVITPDPALEPSTTNGHTPPTVIPKDSGLPCAGQVIAELKPPALMMVINRVAALMHGADRDRWAVLLAALQVERAKRMERGKRRNGKEPQP